MAKDWRASLRHSVIMKLAITLAVGLVLAFLALAIMQGQTRTDDEIPALRPRGSIIVGAEVDTVTSAESLVGYSLASPQDAPGDLELKSIRVQAETKTVYMVFARPSLTLPSELSWSWLLDNDCWVLVQSPQDSTVSPEKLIDDIVVQSGGRASRITVGGSPGLMYCPGDLDSAVHWWSGGIHYALITPRETDYSDLVTFAEAIAAQM